jgi:hypothetical protein
MLQDQFGPTDPIVADAAALRTKFVELAEEHHDLDYMITALSTASGCDELLVARLKKRKLRLKDEIAHVTDELHRLGDSTAHP